MQEQSATGARPTITPDANRLPGQRFAGNASQEGAAAWRSSTLRVGSRK